MGRNSQMGRFIGGLLDNDSAFGQLMNRCWIIIGANLMFVLFSMPLITMGPAFVALYHVMLKTLRGDGVLNPIREFWKGFRANFKQGMICWGVTILLVVLGSFDLSFCRQAGGIFTWFQYAIYVLAVVLFVILMFLFPVMAAFADTIPHLIRNAIFFAAKNPIRLLVMAFFQVFPLYLTYTDPHMMPLYAFLWTVFGFGAIAMIGSSLLLKDFSRFLPSLEEEGEEDSHTPSLEGKEKKEKEILQDMEKLGM